MIDTWYCIRCGKMKESKVFPSDGLCPECREAQRVINYTNRTKCEGEQVMAGNSLQLALEGLTVFIEDKRRAFQQCPDP